jgi:ADP-L-glycero-D-manno-heptose 6-epimerase
LNLDKLLFNEYTNDKNIKIIALRYFNVYGPHEDYKGRMASMIIQLAKHMNNGKNPKIFKYGEQCRDFIYVKDVVQANIKAALSDKSGIYNVGTGKSRSFNDILLILKNLMNTDMETIYIDNPYTFYQDNTKADITTTCKDLNYDPLYSLEQGVSDYYQYLQNNWTKGNIE